MDIPFYIRILRRRWRLMAGLTLAVALASAGVAALRTPRYTTSMLLLVTRDEQATGAAGLSDQREDTTAQDLPAIIQGAALQHDLAAELARRGWPPEAGTPSIMSSYSEHTVHVTIEAGAPDQPLLAAEALLAMLRHGGLAYWGDPDATAERPGLNIGILAPPAPAVPKQGPRALAIELALRSLLGLGAAAGLALLIERAERKLLRSA